MVLVNLSRAPIFDDVATHVIYLALRIAVNFMSYEFQPPAEVNLFHMSVEVIV